MCEKAMVFDKRKKLFFGLKLSLIEIIKIIYFWAIQQEVVTITKMIEVSNKTVIAYFKILRELSIKALEKNKMMIGGDGSIVEIDESLMAKVKHWKGIFERKIIEPFVELFFFVGRDLKRKQIWVFGMKTRGKKECLFFVVESRDAVTLLPLIVQHVKSGSIIMSDCWKAYNNINQHGYSHYTVNHSYNFVNPDVIDKNFKVHTNGIESIWKDAKRQLKRMAGIKRGYVQSYLDEFTWRYM